MDFRNLSTSIYQTHTYMKYCKLKKFTSFPFTSQKKHAETISISKMGGAGWRTAYLGDGDTHKENAIAVGVPRGSKAATLHAEPCLPDIHQSPSLSHTANETCVPRDVPQVPTTTRIPESFSWTPQHIPRPLDSKHTAFGQFKHQWTVRPERSMQSQQKQRNRKSVVAKGQRLSSNTWGW